MIKNSKKCKECDRPAFSKGLCQIHTKTKPLSKGAGKIKSKRESTVNKNTAKKELRDVYFDYHINKIIENNLSCQECGCKLNGDRSEIAHIISKSKNPEVEDISDNILYLCGVNSYNQCHSKFDQSLDKRKNMRVFDIAVNNFLKIKHLIVNFTNEVKFMDR